MRVLVIPEDFRNDQYLMKPLFQRLFRTLGWRHAHIRICRDPLLGGIGEALKDERIQQIMTQYRGTMDIFILCVDRDGNEGRQERLKEIEKRFGNDRHFFAENAWEEIETWALAGLKLPKNWDWKRVRAEVHVKETYFEPLARLRGVANSHSGGREELGEEAARNVPAIRMKCPEDFDTLAKRIDASINDGAEA